MHVQVHGRIVVCTCVDVRAWVGVVACPVSGHTHRLSMVAISALMPSILLFSVCAAFSTALRSGRGTGVGCRAGIHTHARTCQHTKRAYYRARP
jgi:hypothetical protein